MVHSKSTDSTDGGWMRVGHIRELWAQWRDADLRWQSAQNAGAGRQEVERLRASAYQRLIVFQQAFVAHFKRYPLPSEYQFGTVSRNEETRGT